MHSGGRMTGKQEKGKESNGITLLLKEVGRIVNSYGTLPTTESNLLVAQERQKKIEQDLQEATKTVIAWEAEVKTEKRKLAELIVDLSHLGCPEAEIKKVWNGYNNHEIAE